MKNTGNGEYHSGPVSTDRVREWRKANPGYWRRPKIPGGNGHADDLAAVLRELALQDTCDALQDSWPPYLIGLLGLVVWLRGTALQDIIARDLREIMMNGYAMLAALESPAPSPGTPNTREPH